jgi:hypothetical protein
MIGYFWIEGLLFFRNSKNKLFYLFGKVSLFIAVISLIAFIGFGYTKEAFMKPGFSYNTVGEAITYALKNKAIIVMPGEMEGYRFRMIINSYSGNEKDMNIIPASEINNTCKDTDKYRKTFVVFEKNSHKIMSFNELCL